MGSRGDSVDSSPPIQPADPARRDIAAKSCTRPVAQSPLKAIQLCRDGSAREQFEPIRTLDIRAPPTKTKHGLRRADFGRLHRFARVVRRTQHGGQHVRALIGSDAVQCPPHLPSRCDVIDLCGSGAVRGRAILSPPRAAGVGIAVGPSRRNRRFLGTLGIHRKCPETCATSGVRPCRIRRAIPSTPPGHCPAATTRSASSPQNTYSVFGNRGQRVQEFKATVTCRRRCTRRDRGHSLQFSTSSPTTPAEGSHLGPSVSWHVLACPGMSWHVLACPGRRCSLPRPGFRTISPATAISKPMNGDWSTIFHPWATGSPPRLPPAASRQPPDEVEGLRRPSRHDPDPPWRRAPRRRRGAVDRIPWMPWG